MKCIKCKTNNICKADYCKNCAYKFSEKEQKIAKGKTLIGKIEKVEQVYNVCSFKIITDHILFKIASIILILGIGIYYAVTNGTTLKILESDNYKIQYNKNYQEYYLIGNTKELLLKLYIPEKYNEIVVECYDKDNNFVNENHYKKTDSIALKSNNQQYYYLIKGNNNQSEDIKIYVYLDKNAEVTYEKE